MKLTPEVRAFLATIGRKGGAAGKGVSTPAKSRAARRNGRRGGRPKKHVQR